MRVALKVMALSLLWAVAVGSIALLAFGQGTVIGGHQFQFGRGPWAVAIASEIAKIGGLLLIMNGAIATSKSIWSW
jgi:hypothetical protein